MTLQIENEQEDALFEGVEELAGQICGRVLETENCPYEAEISLTFTDDEGIRELNRQFRGIDRATDVLSFPMTDFPAPADYGFLEDDELSAGCFHPESGELLLGDIVISTERARAQADAYGHSLKREIAFLIAHSMLHLLGYDHMSPEEAADMEKRQEDILQSLGITREG